jgi:uncharacterized OB-fold protein
VSASLALDARLFYRADVPEPGDPVQLAASRCRHCARFEFPVHPVCPVCRSGVDTVPLSTTAVVDGFTTVSAPPPGGLVEAPYTVAAAAFPEGIAVLGVVVGPEDDLQMGDPLTVVAMAVGERTGFGFRRD